MLTVLVAMLTVLVAMLTVLVAMLTVLVAMLTVLVAMLTVLVAAVVIWRAVGRMASRWPVAPASRPVRVRVRAGMRMGMVVCLRFVLHAGLLLVPPHPTCPVVSNCTVDRRILGSATSLGAARTSVRCA